MANKTVGKLQKQLSQLHRERTLSKARSIVAEAHILFLVRLSSCPLGSAIESHWQLKQSLKSNLSLVQWRF